MVRLLVLLFTVAVVDTFSDIYNTVIYYAFKCNYLTRLYERELECTCTFKKAVIDEDGIDRGLLFVCVEKTHSANFL